MACASAAYRSACPELSLATGSPLEHGAGSPDGAAGQAGLAPGRPSGLVPRPALQANVTVHRAGARVANRELVLPPLALPHPHHPHSPAWLPPAPPPPPPPH